MGGIIAAIDAIARETVILACIGFLIGGIDDLALDAVYWLGRLTGRRPDMRIEDLPAPTAGRIAIFVPAWDEAGVIGRMLATTLARFGDDDFRLYVGVYPNDRATIDAVSVVAETDPRVRLVINIRSGPTTKADCLNQLWDALLREEGAEGWSAKAVAFHDAEDVVHRDELRVYRALLGKHQVIQLPVMPLVDRGSPLVAGHYIDEFAEAHGLRLVARGWLGAPMPLAGVGCAIDRALLERVAEARGGLPFDADSLTEDYELGLRTAMLGGRQIFARVRDADGRVIAVAEYFPNTVREAVAQKARWMIGIALDGWDRLGWGRASDWRDHWMRLRDRRAPLSLLVLFTAYVALMAWGASLALHWLAGDRAPQPSEPMMVLLTINAAMLAWRLVMRAWFTGRAYGWWQAFLSLPRVLVGNFIALMAARAAMSRYVAALRGRRPVWDKTRHRFPEAIEP
ncbi:MAG: glycosyl transferase family protein [Sphingomonas sp.]|uniref:glycosyl transferase family protein n=1 Tax=Sphingomonas sp. TaxID=28214 RepID=UPI001AD1E170|nr:glycosyl transferase family protein [Sphingomonas sp.]MBN8816471.1 glycosyl transferase family protein [Sphingomonas sp.]